MGRTTGRGKRAGMAALAAGVWLLACGAAAAEGETDAAGEGASAGAQIGRQEYMAGCAQCHGLDGRGDGIIADYLSLAPPDLTTIQRQNGGVFPAGVLYEIIEGRSAIGAHGTREMPAWGDRYSVEAHMLLGWRIEPETRDAFIRGRILALVEYLASIQEQ